MNAFRFALAGVALALAGTLVIGVADASAKTKKHDDTSTQTTQARPSDLGGSDRQLQGRFYKGSHKKTHKAQKSTESK
jgi:hypothetical protein